MVSFIYPLLQTPCEAGTVPPSSHSSTQKPPIKNSGVLKNRKIDVMTTGTVILAVVTGVALIVLFSPAVLMALSAAAIAALVGGVIVGLVIGLYLLSSIRENEQGNFSLQLDRPRSP